MLIGAVRNKKNNVLLQETFAEKKNVFLTISIDFHQPMSVQYIFSIAGDFAVAHMFLQNASCVLHTHTFTRTCIANRRDQQVENVSNMVMWGLPNPA